MVDFNDIKRLQERVSSQREEIRSLTYKLSFILEEVLAGYWDWDIQNDTEYMSPSFKSMFGYADYEIKNTPEWWQKNICPEDLETVLQNFNKHVESRGSYPYSQAVRYKHKTGSIVYVLCTGKVVEWSDDDAPIRMVGTHIELSKEQYEALKGVRNG